MYYVINLCEREVVAESTERDIAHVYLVDAVRDSDGIYTYDDFAIMDEEELENYY